MSILTSSGGQDTPTGYRAFLSYSHRDSSFVRKLHQRLESYRTPAALVGQPTNLGAIPKRIVPIFRDRDELPSGADLSEKIRDALQASLCLVVVASPWSARSPWVDKEVRAFKALGRADRVFTIIADGEPNASDRPGLEAKECFCPALRFTLDANGELTGTRAEPLAADARKAGDGSDDAALKLIAGLLGVGFDRLKQRERLRRRRRRPATFAMGAMAVIAAGFAYTGLADINVTVPGAQSIRTELDHWGVSVFRPTPPPQLVVGQLTLSRALLRNRLVDMVSRPGWFQRASRLSVWEFGQVSTALARNPTASIDDIAIAARQLTAALDVKPPIQVGGHSLGWTEPDDVIRTESSLWMLMGLSTVIPRAGALPEPARSSLSRLVDIAQEAADLCHESDGGWNDVPRRRNPSDHYVYTTAFALHALVDLKEAGLCWRGACGRRNAMIAASTSWLIELFVNEPGARGWRIDKDDDQSPNANLSSIVLGALGRAAWRSNIAIPAPIRDFAYDHIALLYGHPYQPSTAPINKFTEFEDWNGKVQRISVPARIFWLPWSFDAAVTWAKLAERDHAPPERRRALARSIGYMAVALADPMRQEEIAERALPYAVAETMTGLDRDP